MFTGRHKFHKSRFSDACNNFSKESHRVFNVLRPRLAMNLLSKDRPKSLDSLPKVLLQTVDVNGEIFLTKNLLHEIVALESAVRTNMVLWTSCLLWHDVFLKSCSVII